MGWIARTPSTTRPWKAGWRESSGKKKYRSFKKRSDAVAHLAKVSVSVADGTYVDPNLGRTRVADFWPMFLSSSPHLRPSTRSKYEFMGKAHILPVIGERRLASLTRLDVERVIANLADKPASAVAAFQVLHRMLAVAEAGGYVARNVARGVSVPKATDRGMRFLSAEELARIADAIEPRYRALVLLLGLTGLRVGEATALLVEDVDLLRRRASITKSAVEVEGRLIVGPTKNRKSRAVSLPSVVVDELARHLSEYPASRGSPLFTGPKGGPLRRSNFRRAAWLPALREAGIEDPRPRIHDLRHTAASLAIAVGAHPKQVQEQLGHSSIVLTLNRYSHLFPQLSETLAQALDAGYREATGVPQGMIDAR